MISDPWWERAACRIENHALFAEPEHREPPTEALERLQTARAICATCPVTEPCLREAQQNKDDGMRGGFLLAAGKPRRLPQKPPPPLMPHGTTAAYTRHIRQKTKPCDACREANRIKDEQFRNKQKAGKAA